MASLFDPLEAEGLDEEEKPFFDVLKASLYFPSTPRVLARRLSDDIVFFCSSAKEDEDPQGILCMAWDIMFDMIAYIPADHEWQDLWVDGLKLLKTRENLPATGNNSFQLSWKELPQFYMKQRERLDGNSDDNTKYRNLTSFNARLHAAGVTQTHLYPISTFRTTLEKYDSSDSVPEAMMWVATEWMIRCADGILEFLKQSDDPESERELALWSFGDAYTEKEMEGVGLLSVERWNLWKKWLMKKKEKLSEGGGDATNPTVLERISEALEKMNEAEGRV